ncbi:MAG TPA: helix-turn-helix transcriptional regulator [Pseudonocardiaceae bacterium]|nr:helix-turn-helix transcriptional regulator [Pseudonocardiaceae bacterium]
MAGPTVRRIQLGRELRRLRDAAGVSVLGARAAIDCSKSRFEHIERGRNVPSKAELIVLLRDTYHAGDAVAALDEIREEASKRGWWSTYALPEWLAVYVGLEHDATEVRQLALESIPGLLQTEEYMRTVYTIDPRSTEKDITKRLASRLQRQERLTGDDPLKLTAVVSEAALVRCARDRRVAADQLSRLVERAAWPSIELRVLPFDAGLHVGMNGPFSLLSFPADLLADVAYHEYPVGGHIIDNPSIVSQLGTLFSELHSHALGASESLAMIAQLAKQTHE